MTNEKPQTQALAPIDTVRQMLEKPSMKAQIAMALPRHLSIDRMVRTAMTSLQKNPALLDCAPVTLAGAIIQCAQLGLEPDDGTGKAYLVPFFNGKKGRKEVQFIAGYRGLIDLARRSGQVLGIEARVVHEKDRFQYSFGLEPLLDHQPSAKAESGAMVYVYAIARFRSGGSQFDVMNKAEVDKIRKRSKAGESGPWITDYEEMAKKTVIRRLAKLLPSSPEFQKATSLDERAELGLPQDLGVIVDPEEKGTPEPLPEEPAADIPMPTQAEIELGEAPEAEKVKARR